MFASAFFPASEPVGGGERLRLRGARRCEGVVLPAGGEAHLRIAVTRIAVTRIAVTRIAMTRIAVTRIAVTRIAVTRIALSHTSEHC